MQVFGLMVNRQWRRGSSGVVPRWPPVFRLRVFLLGILFAPTGIGLRRPQIKNDGLIVLAIHPVRLVFEVALPLRHHPPDVGQELLIPAHHSQRLLVLPGLGEPDTLLVLLRGHLHGQHLAFRIEQELHKGGVLKGLNRASSEAELAAFYDEGRGVDLLYDFNHSEILQHFHQPFSFQ